MSSFHFTKLDINEQAQFLHKICLCLEQRSLNYNKNPEDIFKELENVLETEEGLIETTREEKLKLLNYLMTGNQNGIQKEGAEIGTPDEQIIRVENLCQDLKKCLLKEIKNLVLAKVESQENTASLEAERENLPLKSNKGFIGTFLGPITKPLSKTLKQLTGVSHPSKMERWNTANEAVQLAQTKQAIIEEQAHYLNDILNTVEATLNNPIFKLHAVKEKPKR